MDDAPYTDDLDLDAVATRDDLAALLRTVHIRADKPSLRSLEARTCHSATPLSKTAVAEMLKGVRFPRKAVMVAFLRACGMKDDNVESWRRTWERVAEGEKGTPRPAAGLIELAHESKRVAESPDPKSNDTSRLDLAPDERIGASLKIIIENINTAMGVRHPVFLDEIAAACNDFAGKSTDWRQGQVVIPADRYNESVRHQYESSKKWVFATSIPEYFDAWSSDLGEEFMEAHRRSRARVTRVFVFDDATDIRTEELEEMARQSASQIEVRIYIDNEDRFFNFPTDISRDFSIIDDKVISITRSYGRNNFETVWYYHDAERLARFARIRQALLKHSKTLEQFQDLYRRSL